MDGPLVVTASEENGDCADSVVPPGGFDGSDLGDRPAAAEFVIEGNDEIACDQVRLGSSPLVERMEMGYYLLDVP
jgi:hypothetical protein